MKRILALGALILFFAVTPAYSRVAAYRDDPAGPDYDACDKDNSTSLHCTNDFDLKSYTTSYICQLGPSAPLCTTDQKKLPYLQQKSVIGSVNGYIAALYDPNNRPASTVAFVQDMSYTLGFGHRPAYAQGIGFSGLVPLLPIWKVFRNLSYAIMAVIIVIVGFMVMFRQKIDPKTVVTVQNAIPRIIITLLLITFSYAIVAIMIDLMYIFMFVVINMLVGASGGKLGPGTTGAYATGGFPTLVAGMFSGGFSAIDDIIRFLNPGASFTAQSLSSIGNFLTSFNLFMSRVVSTPVEAVLLVLLLLIALLFGLIRIFFMLLNAYVQIIIALLIGPLQLLLDAFPGGQGFTSWISNLAVNIMVFPLTAILILIGTILTQSNSGTNLWTPPLLGFPGWTGQGAAGTSGVSGLIGLGILMIIPNIINSIKEALKVKPALPAGPGAIFAPITGAYQSGMGLLSQFFYAAQLKQMFLPGEKKPH